MATQDQSYDESVGESAHGDVQAVIRGIEASLGDLTGFVSAVKSSWDGDEMTQYNAIQDNWDKSADTVKNILQSVHAALGSKTGSVKQMRSRVKSTLINAQA